jgi:hypothetical protein
MKNNRASLTTAQAERLVRNIGDPAFSLGRLDALGGKEGETSVIQLNLGWQSHIDLYEQLHNNPDKFEVVQESDFGGGRSNVKCVVRYVRKGPWKLEKQTDSEKPSSEKSSKSSKKKEEPEEEKGVIGFGAAVSHPTSEKKKAAKPAKKKVPKKKKKKAPQKKTKKSSPKKSRPAKKRAPKKKKAKGKAKKKKPSR